MNAEAGPPRRCALPGCDELIESAPGRSNRLYCTAAHRSAARQSRRTAVQPEAQASYAWLNEPTPPAVPDPVDEPAPSVTLSPSAPSAVDEEEGTGERAAPARRFAGGSAAARRAVASWTRSARSTGGARPRSSSLSRQQGLARRRRAVAVFGATAILIGGYSVTSGQQVPDRSAPVPTPAAGADQWASQARVALVSLESQLSSIARTEAAWNAAQHGGRRFDGTPIPVQRLMQLKATLQQQRATLLSQLSAYESLATARQELTTADQRLADLTSTTPGAPPTGGQSPTEAATAAAWDQQRALREAQRAAKQNELTMLLRSVQAALAAPLPVRAVETRNATDSVLSLIRDEVPPSQRRPTAPDRAALAEGRKPFAERVADDIGTSGPPDPRGPRDEAGSAGDAAPGPGGDARGGPGETMVAAGDGAAEAVPAAVETVTRPVRNAGNAVSDVATGAVDPVTVTGGGGESGGRGEGRARAEERAGGPVSSITEAEPVAAVTDTLDDAATAVTGGDGAAPGGSTGPAAPAADRSQRGSAADLAVLEAIAAGPDPIAGAVGFAERALARQRAAEAADPAAPSESVSPPGSGDPEAPEEDVPADDPGTVPSNSDEEAGPGTEPADGADPVDGVQGDDDATSDSGPGDESDDDEAPSGSGSGEDGAEEPSGSAGSDDGFDPSGDDTDGDDTDGDDTDGDDTDGDDTDGDDTDGDDTDASDADASDADDPAAANPAETDEDDSDADTADTEEPEGDGTD